jgi:hypothetical protein
VFFEENKLTGDFDAVCELPSFKKTTLRNNNHKEVRLAADCKKEVRCKCCIECCDDGHPGDCGAGVWLDEELTRSYDGHSYSIADLSFLVDKSVLD